MHGNLTLLKRSHSLDTWTNAPRPHIAAMARDASRAPRQAPGLNVTTSTSLGLTDATDLPAPAGWSAPAGAAHDEGSRDEEATVLDPDAARRLAELVAQAEPATSLAGVDELEDDMLDGADEHLAAEADDDEASLDEVAPSLARSDDGPARAKPAPKRRRRGLWVVGGLLAMLGGLGVGGLLVLAALVAGGWWWWSSQADVELAPVEVVDVTEPAPEVAPASEPVAEEPVVEATPAPAPVEAAPEPTPEPEPVAAATAPTTSHRSTSSRRTTSSGRSTSSASAAPTTSAGPATTVKLLSSPPTATLFVDGAEVGRTPSKLELTPGRHDVRVTSGGQSADFSVDVRDGGANKWCYAFADGRVHTGSCD